MGSTVLVVASVVDSSLSLGTFGEIAPLLDLGLSAVLVSLIIWFIRRRETLVSSGEWVPRRELDYLREDRDSRLAEKDAAISEWRAAHETSERARELLTGQNRDLIDVVRDHGRFLDAFRSQLERDPDATADSA